MSERKITFGNPEIKTGIQKYTEIHQKSADAKFFNADSISYWIKRNLKRIESLDSDQYQNATLKVINRAKKLYELLLDPIVQERMKDSGVDIEDEDFLLDTVVEAQDSLDALYNIISGIALEDFSKKKKKMIKNTLLTGIALSKLNKEDSLILSEEELGDRLWKTNESKKKRSIIRDINRENLMALVKSARFNWSKLSPRDFTQLIRNAMLKELYSPISDVILRAFDRGIPVTKSIVSWSLDALRVSKDTKGLHVVIESIKNEDVELDSIDYGATLNAFGKCLDVKGVRDVWEIIKNKNIKLDVISYSSALNAFGECLDIEGVRDVWNTIQGMDIKLNDIGYSSALNAFGKCSDAEGVRDVWEVIKDKDTDLDLIEYSAVLEAFGKCLDVEGVRDVWNTAQGTDIELSDLSCSSALNAFGRCSDAKGVRDVWGVIKDKNIKLDAIVYGAALKASSNTSQSDLFREVYDDLCNAHIEKNLAFISYITAVKFGGYIKEEEIVADAINVLLKNDQFYTARSFGKILTVIKDIPSVEFLNVVKDNLYKLTKVDRDSLEGRLKSAEYALQK